MQAENEGPWGWRANTGEIGDKLKRTGQKLLPYLSTPAGGLGRQTTATEEEDCDAYR